MFHRRLWPPNFLPRLTVTAVIGSDDTPHDCIVGRTVYGVNDSYRLLTLDEAGRSRNDERTGLVA